MFKSEVELRVALENKIENWEKALDRVARCLLKENIIDKKYVEKIKENVKEKGTYFLIDYDIVLAHARPEDGVNGNSLAFLKLEEGVEFPGYEGKKLDMIFIFSATNKENHIKWLKNFSKVMDDESMVKKIRSTNDKKEIIEIFQNKLIQAKI